MQALSVLVWSEPGRVGPAASERLREATKRLPSARPKKLTVESPRKALQLYSLRLSLYVPYTFPHACDQPRKFVDLYQPRSRLPGTRGPDFSPHRGRVGITGIHSPEESENSGFGNRGWTAAGFGAERASRDGGGRCGLFPRDARRGTQAVRRRFTGERRCAQHGLFPAQPRKIRCSHFELCHSSSGS